METLLVPIVRETFAAHFTSRSWTTPRQQITAGYPRFIQPTHATATFVYTHDLGALVAQNCLVTLSLAKSDIEPGLTTTPTLEFSTDNTTWSTFSGSWSVFTQNFRYVKVTIDFTGDTFALARINEIQLLVNVREQTDGGTLTAENSDTNGTFVSFNKTFIDVSSVTITPNHQAGETKGITAVWTLDDEPYPEGFYVRLYSNNSGLRIDGNAGWSARGS